MLFFIMGMLTKIKFLQPLDYIRYLKSYQKPPDKSTPFSNGAPDRERATDSKQKQLQIRTNDLI